MFDFAHPATSYFIFSNYVFTNVLRKPLLLITAVLLPYIPRSRHSVLRLIIYWILYRYLVTAGTGRYTRTYSDDAAGCMFLFPHICGHQTWIDTHALLFPLNNCNLTTHIPNINTYVYLYIEARTYTKFKVSLNFSAE